MINLIGMFTCLIAAILVISNGGPTEGAIINGPVWFYGLWILAGLNLLFYVANRKMK